MTQPVKTLSLGLHLVLSLLVSVVDGEKLMVILLDGFRWDYCQKYTSDLPGFQRLFENGVRADYLIPPFPSVTYTSLYTLVTGLHPESHGIVGNNMWDEKENETFDFGFNPEHVHPHWWNGGEPVWITATRQNRPTYVYDYLGCEAEIRGRRATYCDEYPGYPTDSEAGKARFLRQYMEGLERLQTNTADLVLIYFELSDYLAHLHGPESPEVRDIIRWLDAQIDHILDEISERGLDDDLNLLVLSDHGMTDISESRVIDLSGVLEETDFDRIMDHGPITSVWPKLGMEQKVFEKLRAFSPHMTVYLKHKIPDRWRRKDHFRVAPITCVADTGWMIVQPGDKLPSREGKTYVGYHGYDNNGMDMRSIFHAIGPNIRIGQRVKAFENVHVYQLMCRILQIEPSPNNGSWDKVKDIYVERSYPVMVTCWMTSLCLASIALLSAVLYMYCTGVKNYKSKRN